jgi:hypothetical protein
MGLTLFYREYDHKNQSDAPISPRLNAMIACSPNSVRLDRAVVGQS